MAIVKYGTFLSYALPPGVSTAAIKSVGEDFYGSLLRSSDGPNNTQQFHKVILTTDASNVDACIPALGTGDGLGYILTDYSSPTIKGLLATVTLTYSALSAYTPSPTATEQSSTRQVSITQWPDFAANAGTGAAPLNKAIFNINPKTDVVDADSSFSGWEPTSIFAGNDTYEVGCISYTYTEYSTSEFSSDADSLGTISSPSGAPDLGDGNYLLTASNRGKQSYFYFKSDTSVGSNPAWNTTIYG
jgi:hypothetical protein